jgi:hypothetical protein
MTEPFYGIAREKLIDVLDDKHCETELTKNGTKEFYMKPEVLCVGYNQSNNVRVYVKDTVGNYHHVPMDQDRFHNLVSLEKLWYIVGKQTSIL